MRISENCWPTRLKGSLRENFHDGLITPDEFDEELQNLPAAEMAALIRDIVNSTIISIV